MIINKCKNDKINLSRTIIINVSHILIFLPILQFITTFQARELIHFFTHQVNQILSVYLTAIRASKITVVS